MKKVEVLLVIAIIGVLAALLGPDLVGPSYIRHHFAPRHKNITIEQLEHNLGMQLKKREIKIQDVGYVLGEGPLVSWAMPSGPPIYVFDSQGHLVDYTLDVGDDPRFKRKWVDGVKE